MSLLEAKGLKKRFRQRSGFVRGGDFWIAALDGVDLSLSDAEALGVVGESGSGKTTLARVLAGLTALDAGQVILDGKPLPTDASIPRESRRKIQYIFQNPLNSLNPRFTVEETLREPLALHRVVEPSAVSARIEVLLDQVKLPKACRSRLPWQLSGGERQRVGIARALAVEPRILLCDEPIASLDVSVGVKILELLRDINQQAKTTLFFISHDLRAVAALCSRILVMRQGRIIEQGPAQQILSRPKDPYTCLLVASAALDLDQVV